MMLVEDLMSELSRNIEDMFENVFNSHKELLVLNQFNDELLSFNGEISQETVNSITTDVETSMQLNGDKKGAVKRMFNVLIEALQNIRIHGSEDEQTEKKLMFLLISSKDVSYSVVTANLVEKDKSQILKNRVEKLNELSLAEIKEQYLEVLTNGVLSEKGGAGLGFITMALKSKNKLKVSLEDVSDTKTAFIVGMTIDR